MDKQMLKSLVYPFKRVYDFYLWCNSFGDPRNESWPLMSSPIPTLVILVIYLSFVKYGPIWMKKRKPYDLRFLLVVYNFAVTGLNGWMAFELLECGLKRKYNFICQLVDTSNNEYEVRIAKAIWWYYFSKLIEFLDTTFFILRKKSSQLTFLHVYHHSSMFLFWWVGARFVPGGSALSGAMVNCFVHVVMYAYYGLAAMGPKVQLKFLWWKKYLTILQLIQFTTGVVLGLNAILTGCQFTRWMQYVFVGYAFSFIVLFGKFYRTAYSSSSKNSSHYTRSSSSTSSEKTSLLTSSTPSKSGSTTTSHLMTSSSPTSRVKPGHGRKKQQHHSQRKHKKGGKDD